MKGQGKGQGQGQGQVQGPVDAFLDQLGALGVYAIVQYCGYAFCSVSIAFQLFAIVFTGQDVPYACSTPGPNATNDHVAKMQPSRVSRIEELSAQNRSDGYSSSLYNLTVTLLDRENAIQPTNNETDMDHPHGQHSINLTTNIPITSTNITPTQNFKALKEFSMVWEFDLLCEKAPLLGLTQTLLGFGQMVGSLFLPVFGDRFGRKWMQIVSHVMIAASGLAVAFAPSYAVVAVAKFFMGIAVIGLRLSSTSAMMELFPARYRSIASAVCPGLLFALSSTLMALVAYILQLHSWRTIQLAFTSACLLMFVQIVILDEPLRALLASNKRKEALGVLRKAARWNKKDVVPLEQQLNTLLVTSPQPTATNPTATHVTTTKDSGDINADPHQEKLDIKDGVAAVQEKSNIHRSKGSSAQDLSDSPLLSEKCDVDEPSDNTLHDRSDSLSSVKNNVSRSDIAARHVNANLENAEEINNECRNLTYSPQLLTDNSTEPFLKTEEQELGTNRCQKRTASLHKTGDDISTEPFLKASEVVEDAGDAQCGGQEGEKKKFTDKPPARKVTFTQLMKHRRLRVNILISCVLWFVSSTTYFGLYLTTGSLAGDLYVNFALNSLVEIPSCILYLFTVDRYGRKWTVFCFQVVCAVCLISSGICRVFQGQKSAEVISTVLSMLGKLGATAAVNVTVMYTGELFPTICRNQCLGFGVAAGRFGMMIAPFATTLAHYFAWAPGVVFGTISLLAAFCLFFVPETTGKELPQTLEDLDRWYQQPEKVKTDPEKSLAEVEDRNKTNPPL